MRKFSTHSDEGQVSQLWPLLSSHSLPASCRRCLGTHAIWPAGVPESTDETLSNMRRPALLLLLLPLPPHPSYPCSPLCCALQCVREVTQQQRALAASGGGGGSRRASSSGSAEELGGTYSDDASPPQLQTPSPSSSPPPPQFPPVQRVRPRTQLLPVPLARAACAGAACIVRLRAGCFILQPHGVPASAAWNSTMLWLSARYPTPLCPIRPCRRCSCQSRWDWEAPLLISLRRGLPSPTGPYPAVGYIYAPLRRC